MGRIILLSEEVSHKIAAGEVIEAPFSVVRELLDNSIDAEATEIWVVINNGGKDYIFVRDNGLGMDEEDALLSIEKHSTSKIKRVDDLSNISTLGFRGEALSSICRVSDFEMVTAHQGSSFGTIVRCYFGKNIQSEPYPANPGTEIRVRNLFFNLPARRKFLKSNRAEFLKVKSEIIKKAIPFYNTGFHFTVDDKIVFNLMPTKDIKQRLEGLYGNGLTKNLLTLNTETDGIRVTVYLTDRGFTLSNRRLQYVFVNNRYVEDKSIIYTINEAVKGYYPPTRYPACFLFIDLPPEMVDVNIHPTKREVRFKNQKEINRCIYQLIGNSLNPNTYLYLDANSKIEPSIEKESISFHPPGENSKSVDSYLYKEGSNFQGDDLQKSNLPGKDYYVKSHIEEYREVEKPETFGSDTSASGNMDNTENIYISFGPKGRALRDSAFRIPDISSFEPAKFYFRTSLFNKFLVFETENTICFVDQHAAHERVLFEKLERDSNRSDLAQKTLMFPIIITPPEDVFHRIEENIDEFREVGFDINIFGEGSFKLDAIPGYIPDKLESIVISEFFDGIIKTGFVPEASGIKKKFILIAACRMAVKEGDSLGRKEAEDLFKDLFETDNPLSCPHGRPTILVLTEGALDGLFFRK